MRSSVCPLAECLFGGGDRRFWLLYTLPADHDKEREARCHQTTNPWTMRQGMRILPTESSQSKCPLPLQQYFFIQPPTYLSSMPFHVSKSHSVTSFRIKSVQRATVMRIKCHSLDQPIACNLSWTLSHNCLLDAVTGSHWSHCYLTLLHCKLYWMYLMWFTSHRTSTVLKKKKFWLWITWKAWWSATFSKK